MTYLCFHLSGSTVEILEGAKPVWCLCGDKCLSGCFHSSAIVHGYTRYCNWAGSYVKI